MSPHSHKTQRGFSLLEMLIVVAVLSVVLGAIFNTILDGMKKYRLGKPRQHHSGIAGVPRPDRARPAQRRLSRPEDV